MLRNIRIRCGKKNYFALQMHPYAVTVAKKLKSAVYVYVPQAVSKNTQNAVQIRIILNLLYNRNIARLWHYKMQQRVLYGN